VKKKHVLEANLELLPTFQGELQAVPLFLRQGGLAFVDDERGHAP
jgi:hypothetical protein